MGNATQTIDWVIKGGLTTGALVVIFAFIKGIIITAREHIAALEIRDKRIAQLEEDLERWQNLAIMNSDMADKMVDKLPERERAGGRTRG